MTLADGEVFRPPSAPVVRAPRAVGATGAATGQGAVDEAWSLLVQQALGLGAPSSPAVTTGDARGPDAADPLPTGSEPVPGEERLPRTAGVPGGRSVSLPTSPGDQDGVYRGLLWVAWAVEECSRAFTRISGRLGSVERRISELESARKKESQPVFDVEAVEPPPQAPSDLEEKLERLETRIEEAAGLARRRVDGVEERLRQLDFVPLKVSNLQRSVDQLASAQRRAARTEQDHRSTPSDTTNVEIAELRSQLAIAQRRLAELDSRVNEESMAAVVEAAVRRHMETLVATHTTATTGVDVEGVYRELDAVAEFVAARAASTAESLERIGPLEVAVLELRRDLGRAVAELSASHGMREADVRLHDLERRLQRLEHSGHKVDRLYAALEGLVHIRESDERPSRSSANGTNVAGR